MFRIKQKRYSFILLNKGKKTLLFDKINGKILYHGMLIKYH